MKIIFFIILTLIIVFIIVFIFLNDIIKIANKDFVDNGLVDKIAELEIKKVIKKDKTGENLANKEEVILKDEMIIENILNEETEEKKVKLEEAIYKKENTVNKNDNLLDIRREALEKAM